MAEHALGFAIELALKLSAKITIVHAYEVPTYGYPDGIAMTPEAVDSIRRAAETGLERVTEHARRPGLEVQALLRQGSAWREIDAAAKEAGADLIVMGTHGRHGLARALLGSVAEKVVRSAPCPVLTVHEHETAG
jgi:nucleotide-binding universal stress UspA family protein